MQEPTAIWNRARGVWEKPGTMNLFCEHLEVFSETWPTSGTMLDGKVYSPLTLERHTEDSGFSSQPIPEESLLRTPSAVEGDGGAMSEKQARARNHMLQVRDQMVELAAMNGLKVSKSIERSLFPTPNTMDHLPARDESKIDRSKGGYANVRETVVRELTPHIDWGRFAEAIERWENVIGRPAPNPTKPDGKEETHRLSSEFTEWMMGLPEGFITGVGVGRKEELRACGNGVVPQQAELALRELLELE